MNDIFGIQPLAEASKLIVSKSVDGISSFLSHVCEPALQELGLMLSDNVRVWRLNNIVNTLEKAKGKFEFKDDKLQIKANPKVALSIIEECSLIDEEYLQEWWAGLFASSCTEDGKDDQNLVYINILRQLTSFEVKLLEYICKTCIKKISPNGLILSDDVLELSITEISGITGVDDVYRMDREMDHLCSLSLLTDQAFISSGFIFSDEKLIAKLTPTALALNLHYRVSAIGISMKEFYSDSLEEYKNPDVKFKFS